jgi:Domain of unknown function (DUF4124)
VRLLSVLLLVAAGLALAPDSADADGRHRRFRSDGHGFRRFDGHHGHRHHHHHRGHHHRGFRHQPFFPVFIGPSAAIASTVIVPPVVYASPPPVYAGPPPYMAPPPHMMAPPPPSYGPPVAYPPPPPMPRVVEFPSGRYELRGDGNYSPYTWVWIPNPPVAPPPGPPAPPAATPDAVPERRPAVQMTVYRWTDERGVTTWTDDLEKVPERYRAQARPRP